MSEVSGGALSGDEPLAIRRAKLIGNLESLGYEEFSANEDHVRWVHPALALPHVLVPVHDELEHAERVIAPWLGIQQQERERCAKVVERNCIERRHKVFEVGKGDPEFHHREVILCGQCKGAAAAIREGDQQ